MNDKGSITQDEEGKYYVNGSEIRILQNGVGGATVGFHIGWWGTWVIVHGTIFLACRGIDIVAP